MSNIAIGFMYRDGYNNKSFDFYVLENKNNITIESFEEILERNIDRNEYVPSMLRLPSISPIESHFIDHQESADHPYHEITEIKYIPGKANNEVGYANDVMDVIYCLNHLKEREIQLAHEALVYYENIVRDIRNDINRLNNLS